MAVISLRVISRYEHNTPENLEDLIKYNDLNFTTPNRSRREP